MCSGGQGLLAALLGAGAQGGRRQRPRPAVLAGARGALALRPARRPEAPVKGGRRHALGRRPLAGAEQLLAQAAAPACGHNSQPEPSRLLLMDPRLLLAA